MNYVKIDIQDESTNLRQTAFLSKKAPQSKGLRNVVAGTPIATVVSDPRQSDNPIIAVNSAFSDLTGYQPSEVLDQNCRFLSGQGTEPWLTEKIREAVLRRMPVLVEILNYKKSGAPFRNAVMIAPIHDDEGDLLYFLGSQIEVAQNAQTISDTRREKAFASLQRLSPRQMEVTKLVAKGLLNKQVAQIMGLSLKTVKMHRGLVMEKLNLRSQADLVRLAVEAGL